MKRILELRLPAASKNYCVIDGTSLDLATEEARVLLNEGNIGEQVILTLNEMDEEKFKNLKEFEGW